MRVKNILVSSMLFFTGVGVGSIITWKISSDINEKRIQEEVTYVKEKYSSHSEGIANSESCDTIKNEEDLNCELNAYVDVIKNNQYQENDDKEKEMYQPEIVPPGETWEYEYPVISLTYFEEDNTLVTDKNKIVKNYKELVGEDFKQHFGEYSEDTVVVRNDKVKAYYEILRDYGSFDDYDQTYL